MRRVPWMVVVCLTIACARSAPENENEKRDRLAAVPAVPAAPDGKVARPAPTRAD